jgi:hypothetical protein
LPKDKPRFRKEEFGTVPEAIIKASNLFAEGGDFVIEDDNGRKALKPRIGLPIITVVVVDG